MCHVLIIEDEHLVASVIHMILTDVGLTSVDFAATEDEAVLAARKQKPAVITSDVRLLEGTGPRAVASIHDEHGHIPVIYITGSPEACVGCPPEHIFTKPMNESRVQALFKEFAARADPRRDNASLEMDSPSA